MTDNNPLILSAWGLLDKWGFGDGDVLAEWWWETYDEEAPRNDHEILYNLVVLYLLPFLRKEGFDVTVYRIETNHNPVRAETINGIPREECSDDIFGNLFVSLSRQDVERITQAVVIYENKEDPHAQAQTHGLVTMQDLHAHGEHPRTL